MRLRLLLGGVAVALLLGACDRGTPAPTATPPDTTPIPDIEATVVAEVQARLKAAPAVADAGPVSAATVESISAFAASHREIARDWEKFHVDFDAWRNGLVVCDASSVEVSLRAFAGTIGEIAALARALPRSPALRELGDKLITSTEAEEESVRRLRDEWRPDDDSVFANVDTQRSAALALQREALDALFDLQERTAPSTRDLLASYSSAFDQLSSDWDGFRRSYDSFRSREPDLSSAEVVAQLSQLVDDFRSIVVAVRDLPSHEVTRGVSTLLAEAAEAEDLALRNLRGTFQRSEGRPGEESSGAPGAGELGPIDGGPGSEGSTSESSGTLSGPGEGVTFIARDPTLFDSFDTQLAESNSLRRLAVLQMADLFQETGQEVQTAVKQFAQRFSLVLLEWQQFHSEYDEWRRTEGGCDRSQAAQRMGEFTSDFAAITTRTRELPGGSLRELLVEAAEREEEGLRDLRNTWRPFDAEVYKAFKSRRDSAAKLLRQAAVGLDGLLALHDIPPPGP